MFVFDMMSFQKLSRASAYLNSLRSGAQSRWWWLHLWMPLAVVAVLSLWLFSLDGDLWIADRLYAWEGGRWAWQDTWAARRLLHDGGKQASVFAWLLVLIAWIGGFITPKWRAWRWPLGYLLLAVLFSAALIAVMKAHTNMDCPYDLLRYGGKRVYHGLFEANPNSARGRCFPAGNASAGYAWLALYFFFGTVKPRLRWLGLGIGIAYGLVLGINQQLRGQHFFAHDLWTAMLCWLVALGLYAAMLRGRPMVANRQGDAA